MGILSAIPVIGEVVEKGLDIVDGFFEDKEKAQELKAKIRQQIESQDHQQIMGQMEINKAEASHSSLFVAGWRPFIGWVCGVALGYTFILHPLLTWVWSFLQAEGIVPTDLVPPPTLQTGQLMTVVTGMLGMGAWRTVDKMRGKDTKGIKKRSKS